MSLRDFGEAVRSVFCGWFGRRHLVSSSCRTNLPWCWLQLPPLARASEVRDTVIGAAFAVIIASVILTIVACGESPPGSGNSPDSSQIFMTTPDDRVMFVGSNCFAYSDTVQLSGTLQRETHPGPPNYQDVAAGDEPETGFYLHLETPICTRGVEKYADRGEQSLDSVTRVQLVLDRAGYKALDARVGEPVMLRGTIFAAVTGHHHAPLLLTVKR